MSGRDIGGYGDPHTWGGRDPYPEEKEPYHRCHHCQDGMDDTDGEFGEWCSFECWFPEHRGAIKRFIVEILDNTHCTTVDAVIDRLYRGYSFDLCHYTTPSTLERWKRAIQNRINEKAAQVVETLKAA